MPSAGSHDAMYGVGVAVFPAVLRGPRRTEWNWRIYCFHFCVCLSVCLSVCPCALSPIGLNWRNGVSFGEKCIRLVCEKLTLFPYGQDTVGNAVLLAFWWYSQFQDRSGGFGVMYKNVKLISRKKDFPHTPQHAVQRWRHYRWQACTAHYTPQRDHSLVDTHQTVRLLPSEAWARLDLLFVYFSFRINTATIALNF